MHQGVSSFAAFIVYPFTCQIVVKFTTADPGRKQEIVHEYHYNRYLLLLPKKCKNALTFL